MKTKSASLRHSGFLRWMVIFSAGLAGGILVTSVQGGNPVVPVYTGTHLTIFEQTGGVFETTFSVSTILTAGGEFLTSAGEIYTVTSDGNYLTIVCLHDRALAETGRTGGKVFAQSEISNLPFENLLGHQVGNNIVAVRLDGVPDFPAGLWAATIVDYTLGEMGIPESRFNALGNPLDQGPYGDRHYTMLGIGRSEITIGFLPLLGAAVEVEETPPWADSLTLSLKLPEGYSVAEILFYSLEILKIGAREVSIRPQGWWNIDGSGEDGRLRFQMQFSFSELQPYLLPGDNLLLIRGELSSGIAFQGRAIVSNN